MPTKPLRECKAQGCKVLTREGYCSDHRHVQQEKMKQYNKHSRNKTITSFYKSTDWKRTRQLALIRDNYLSQHCLKDHCFTPADMMHHIVEVKEDWAKKLDLDNLVSLCNACHNKVHGSKGK